MPAAHSRPARTSIGTLTISNDLTLNGATIMQVSHTAADQVAGIGSLTLGGTLQVVVNGALTGGEVFKLFAATNYSRRFRQLRPAGAAQPVGLGREFGARGRHA